MITRYESGDDGYDTIHATWEDEGSPAQFEEIGLFGGRVWNVINRDTTPQFVLHVADGPTELSTSDDSEQTGLVQKSGYYDTRITSGGLIVTRDARGKLSIKQDDLPLEDD